MSDEKLGRRESPRVAAAFCVRYPTVDKLVEAYAADLSHGGIFLTTQRFMPLNAVIRLDFVLPAGGGDVTVIGRVAYVRDAAAAQASDKPAGMGIEFLDMSGENAARIEKFIAERTSERAVPPAPVQPARRLAVLVVDDDAGYRARAAAPFIARGDDVRVAVDGIEGLAACLKVPPDVVLSDVQMPRMDGWTLLRMIRARPTLATVPFIFLTTLGGDDERLRGYQLGVDDYLAKPYLADELLLRVDRLIARQHRAERPQAERKTLRGDLEQVGLPSVLAFLELERKTGVLVVVGSRVARVYLQDGRPLTAEIEGVAPDMPPLARMHELLGWASGQFEFAAQDVNCEEALHTTVTALLLEHARRSDEQDR